MSEQPSQTAPPSAENSATLSGGRMARATLVLMLAYLASAVLGVVRTAVIGATYGAGPEFDSFLAAGRVPELLFNLVAGGALGSAFIPVFAGFLAKGDREGAWRLAGAVITVLTLVTALIAAVTFLVAPWFVQVLLRPGDPPAQQALVADLLRVMLSTVVIFSISGLIMGILNAHQHFWRPAAAMSFYNLGIIFGALFLTPLMGVHGLAWGTVLGALLHLGIQLPALRHLDARWRPSLNLRLPGLAEVVLLMGPRIVGQGVVQINFVVIASFTSGMVDGALAAVNTAFILMFTALGVIGQSVGTAVFPTLAAQTAREDWAAYRRTLSAALRNVLFLGIPASVGLMVLGGPLIVLLYERGEWSPVATAATAWALQFFALGLVGHAVLEILARAFYALHDTWTPVRVGVLTMLLNIALNVLFIQFIGQPGDLAHGPFAGLALAMTVATAVESTTLWLILRRRIGGLEDRRIGGLVGKALAAALIMGAALWALQSLLADWPEAVVAVLGLVVGLGVFGALALLLGIEEAQVVPRMVLGRFGRR